MVNNRKNVSQYAGASPSDVGGGSRKIQGKADGPLYDPAALIALLEVGADGENYAPVIPFTEKCARDVQKYELDARELATLVKDAVRSGTFKGSEWCEKQPGGPWAACDVYVLIRQEWNEYAYKDITQEYYVKLANNRTGKLILLVSMHQ
ncbi:hypothetical protein CBM2592_P320003 [Cupriavidus taiwanensis]|nr:hypothetical protein CBM2592_P320003 [Cupriavidus taiwanensis]SOZ00042.1 hypothetical protein CBM2591_P320003 [Cupriavidus taiwanensis]SPD61819.1 conserved protein of unknown function [Cupriavidus taiwanensis]